MIRKLFRFQKEKPLRKSAAIYISEKFNHLIIAPHHINFDGIVYEQESCFVFNFPTDMTFLGAQIINSLNLFSKKDANLRSKKLAEWPAYMHSKSKSVSAFEKDYIMVSISSVNESTTYLKSNFNTEILRN